MTGLVDEVFVDDRVGRGGERRHGAVIAVTAARTTTAKRGFAVTLGRAFARLTGASVCVVDADVSARESVHGIAARGASVADVARAIERGDDDPLRGVARDPISRCWIVPIGDRRRPVDAARYVDTVCALRSEVDYVIVDTPDAFGAHRRRIDHLAQEVDDLLVAAPAHPSEVPAIVGYLNVVNRARLLGHLPAQLGLLVVPTGDDTHAGRWFANRIDTVPVADVVPRCWGRGAAMCSPDRDVPRPLAALVETLVSGVNDG